MLAKKNPGLEFAKIYARENFFFPKFAKINVVNFANF